jgi:hypothetical protein
MSAKPLRSAVRLTGVKRAGRLNMYDWSFSASAEWVVGALLAATIVATLFV